MQGDPKREDYHSYIVGLLVYFSQCQKITQRQSGSLRCKQSNKSGLFGPRCAVSLPDMFV